jgi:hypothetical protein
MLLKKGFIGIIVVAITVLTGCNMFVTPSSIIKPPVSATVSSKTSEDIIDIVNKFIPQSSRLINPEQPQGAKGVQLSDINSDGKDEIIALYKVNGEDGQLGLIILQRDKKDNWNKIYDYKSEGYAVDILKFADITGDGLEEIIVGWKIGSNASGLSILSMQEGKVNEIFKDYYSKIEIEDMPDKEGKRDGKSEIALWKHDTGGAYQIEVYGWDESKLSPVNAVYPYYFKKVVQYYEEKVKEMPDAAFYWYYLADAQLKSEDFKAALKSVEQGLKIKKVHPDYYPDNKKFENIKSEILRKLGNN